MKKENFSQAKKMLTLIEEKNQLIEKLNSQNNNNIHVGIVYEGRPLAAITVNSEDSLAPLAGEFIHQIIVHTQEEIKKLETELESL